MKAENERMGEHMGFAENLNLCKEKKGMTIASLASVSGVPVGTLSKLLSGAIAEPKLQTVLALARALDCPVSALAGEGDYISETLTDEEIALVRDYRQLSTADRELLRLVMDKRLSDTAVARPATPEVKERKKRSAKILYTRAFKTRASMAQNEIELFEMPASAGFGIFLENAHAEVFTLPAGVQKGTADFAVRVSGNSMEPRFHHGDILLVDSRAQVDVGDLGIFTLDGCGYFKRFMGDCLRSLNTGYEDIPLADYADVRVCGKVVSRLTPKK